MMFDHEVGPINHICCSCGKDTTKEYIGISNEGSYYCIECYELLTGKKAALRCLN